MTAAGVLQELVAHPALGRASEAADGKGPYRSDGAGGLVEIDGWQWVRFVGELTRARNRAHAAEREREAARRKAAASRPQAETEAWWLNFRGNQAGDKAREVASPSPLNSSMLAARVEGRREQLLRRHRKKAAAEAEWYAGKDAARA